MRVYDASLPPEKIAALSTPRKYISKPKKQVWTLPRPPIVRFTSTDSAEIAFWTEQKIAATVEYSWRGEQRSVSDSKPTKTHKLRLAGIPWNRMISYVITAKDAEQGEKRSRTFTLDTLFNFSTPKIAEDDKYPKAAKLAEEILKLTTKRRGTCVVAGGDWRLAREIAAKSEFQVTCVSANQAVVEKGRNALLNDVALYGTRVDILSSPKTDEYPIPQKTVSLLVLPLGGDSASPLPIPYAESLLAPYGGVAVLCGDGKSTSLLKNAGLKWRRIRGKGVLAFCEKGAIRKGAGVWTHQYGLADNAAYAGETLNGVDKTNELEALWLGRPGPRFRADRNGRGPAPLAIDGRLFVLGDGRMLGMDAYTGTILWTLSIPGVTRYNIPRDGGNWCADADNIYAPLRDECLVLKAASGKISKFIKPPEASKSEEWSYIAKVDGLLYGSSTKKGTRFVSYWGGFGWYDALSDPVRSLVCSDSLFAVNPKTSAKAWRYVPKGVVINPTITIGDGKIYFLESENGELRSEKQYRFTGKKLFGDVSAVALNAKTGKLVWKRKFVVNDDFKFPIEVLYMAYANKTLAVVASRYDKKPNGTFYLTVLNSKDGSERFKKSFAWIKGNHGWHMSRPLIVGHRLVVRPKVFDLETGDELATNVFNGHCGSYVAVKNAIITRHGNISLWRLDGKKWKLSGWSYLRPGCWISMVPACGLFLAPEGGGGCKCGCWFEASVGFAPEKTR